MSVIGWNFRVNWFGIEDTRLFSFSVFSKLEMRYFLLVFIFVFTVDVKERLGLNWFVQLRFRLFLCRWLQDSIRHTKPDSIPVIAYKFWIGLEIFLLWEFRSVWKNCWSKAERIFIETQKDFFEWMMLSYICNSKKQNHSWIRFGRCFWIGRLT